MLVGEIMTHEVLAVSPQTPLLQAVRLMSEHRVSGVPVVDGQGRVVGILTEGDLLRRTDTDTAGRKVGWLSHLLMPGRAAADYVMTHGQKTGEVMTPDVITCTEQTELAEAVRLMRHHNVRRLPVLHNEHLVGILSRADLVRQLGRMMPEDVVSEDDATIRTSLLDAIDKADWAPKNMAKITVTKGVVQLDGCVFDIRERDALGVLAENVRGVRQVDNRLVVIEPYTGMMVYDPATGTTAGVPN